MLEFLENIRIGKKMVEFLEKKTTTSQQIDQGGMYSSSSDDKLSENIWFVWSKTSNDGDKWRCYHGDKRTTNNKVKIVLVNKLTKDC